MVTTSSPPARPAPMAPPGGGRRRPKPPVPAGRLPGIGSMLRDIHGAVSWKRVMSAIALGLFAIGFLSATFLRLAPPEYMMHDLIMLAGGGGVLALFERFDRFRQAAPQGKAS